MSKVELSGHISSQFDAELESLRGRLLKMGGLVEQQLEAAVFILGEEKPRDVAHFRGKEKQVNRMEISIDEACLSLLVRRQPAAGDLRTLIAILKTNTDLERIGDEAERAAKMATALVEKERRLPDYHVESIRATGEHACKMIREALDAFARNDPRRALAVVRLEYELNDRYTALLKQMITYIMEEPRHVQTGIEAIWLVRSLERIGDHIRNICEYVIYIAEGRDVRHTDLKTIERHLQEGGDL